MIEFKEGVLFLTYASLISTRGKKKRLQQLIEWCGTDYDGCIVFDESHKAKNFVDGEAESSTKIGKNLAFLCADIFAFVSIFVVLSASVNFQTVVLMGFAFTCI